jgi:peptidoglycan/xylan/chitin deacetylase (PgdA/CDA1 family)
MKPLVSLLFGLVALSLPAEVVFSGLDLDTSSRLLFAARNTTSNADYQVWFRTDLSAGTAPAPLTFYPESAAYLPSLGQLQIRNRFGVWRLDPATAQVTAVSPQIFGQDPGAGEGRALPLAYAPDGRSVLAFRPNGPVSGSLELRDVATQTATEVSTGVDLSYQSLPALWSPDGQFFVYEKKDSLYYYSLRQLKEKRVPEENLRRLGPGLVASVSWGAGGELSYVVDQVLYRILPEEFFTRSLYRAQFQTWGITGKLPFPFRPASDRFWLSPDGKSVLFNLGGRTLFVYPLDVLDFYQTAKLTPLTYLPLPQNLTLKKVLWTRDNRITVLASSLKAGKEETQILRLSASAVQTLDAGAGAVSDLFSSPDESLLLVVKKDGVSVREAATFAEKKGFALDGVVAAFWKDAGTLLVTGRGATVAISLADSSVRTLLLGGLDQAGELDGGQLVGRQGVNWYLWQPATATLPASWKAAGSDFKLPEADTANAFYRAFTSDLPSGPYRNMILIRNLKALTTRPLLPLPEKPYEAFPAAEAGTDDPTGDGQDAPFRHGSRLRVREVALAIDALDSSEGLPEVLRSLRDWGFKATFFVNGEFLRRNPQAAQEIAQAGMETANLFHIPLDLTAPGFIIDASFIRQGLARQEDDWFAATGHELGLLWHAPGWVEGPSLAAGARAANYKTVGTDLGYNLGPDKSVDVPALVEALLKAKKPGSIVPLTLGMKDSTTGESFFNRWDLLLNGLVESGYRGVTVSQLMDHSRP